MFQKHLKDMVRSSFLFFLHSEFELIQLTHLMKYKCISVIIMVCSNSNSYYHWDKEFLGFENCSYKAYFYQFPWKWVRHLSNAPGNGVGKFLFNAPGNGGVCLLDMAELQTANSTQSLNTSSSLCCDWHVYGVSWVQVKLGMLVLWWADGFGQVLPRCPIHVNLAGIGQQLMHNGTTLAYWTPSLETQYFDSTLKVAQLGKVGWVWPFSEFDSSMTY